MAMNLAPWKYRAVFKKFGGPIEDIAIRKIEKSQTILDFDHFEALAFLDPGLIPEWKPCLRVYGEADGTGTGHTETHALYRAISEAIERWAFYSVSRSDHARRFGFHLDPGTSGMAAFPSISRRAAIKHALHESIERWSIAAWWAGQLPAKAMPISNEIHCVVLRPTDDITTVILSTKSRSAHANAYGFAASANLKEALFRAQVELDRNCRVIDEYIFRGGSIMEPGEDLVPLEHRLLWFATETGTASFNEKVHESLSLPRQTAFPRWIINSEIPGQWNQYATVWRCLAAPLEQPTTKGSGLIPFQF